MDHAPIPKNQLINRIHWVDIYKGLAIILMILGHTSSPINNYIYLFHMSAFFFISGYTTNFEKYTFTQYLNKKFVSLIVPYLSINIIYFIFHYILELLKISTFIYDPSTDLKLSPIRIINYLTSFTSTDPLGGATWFLVTLFEVSIFCFVLTKIVKKISPKHFKLIGAVVISLGLILAYKLSYSQSTPVIINYNFDLIPISAFFFLLGIRSQL